MTEPSPFFQSRRADWRDANFKPTSNWDEAKFLWNYGEHVVINKGPSAVQQMLAEVQRRL
jgi:hypothetical protein